MNFQSEFQVMRCLIKYCLVLPDLLLWSLGEVPVRGLGVDWPWSIRIGNSRRCTSRNSSLLGMVLTASGMKSVVEASRIATAEAPDRADSRFPERHASFRRHSRSPWAAPMAD